jgi:hypothetical protein
MLFKSFEDVVILNGNFRQQEDTEFQKLLNHTREGMITDQDYMTYCGRVVGSNNVSNLREVSNPLCLFGKNNHVKGFNDLLQKKTVHLNNQNALLNDNITFECTIDININPNTKNRWTSKGAIRINYHGIPIRLLFSNLHFNFIDISIFLLPSIFFI